MKDTEMKIVSNAEVAKDTFLLVLEGDMGETRPGQFVSIRIPGMTLRRPLGIADQEGRRYSFLYKVKGEGTRILSRIKEGSISVLGPCGRGFSIVDDSVVLGAGLGIAPLLYLDKILHLEGKRHRLICCFNSKEDIPSILLNREEIILVTLDGTYGIQGTFEAALREKDNSAFCYSCGPVGFMKKCQEIFSKGELSLECRMGCSYGVCNGCSIILNDKSIRKICKDGPVFSLSEVSI